MLSLFRRNAAKRPNRRITRTYRPRLELLEDRMVLSAVVDGFEGLTLSPFWDLRTDSGSITFPSTAQVHSGNQSVQLNSTADTGQKNIELNHLFPEPVFGRVSVWVYDTGADVVSSNYIGLRVENRVTGGGASLFTQDYDLGPTDGGIYYYTHFAVESGIPTSIDRTQAWHHFEISAMPDSLVLRIDGVTVYSGPGGNQFDFLAIDMHGPTWRPAWVSYFDDFEFVPLGDACVAPPAGLIAWWPAEGNASDIAGSHHGTLVGDTTFAAGKVGQAFSFDGIGDHAFIGNPATLHLQDLTIEAWVKRASASQTTRDPAVGNQGVVFAFGQNGYGLVLNPTGELHFTKVGISAVESSLVRVIDTEWHHIAVAKSGSAVRFYVDGVEQIGAPYDPGFTFTTNAAIGVRGDDLRQSFWGLIDELDIYNRGLSQSEIQAIYNAGSAGKCMSQASVQAVLINHGSAQRSQVTSLTVLFSGIVTLDPGAFELRDQTGSLVSVDVATGEYEGLSYAYLTFSGPDILAGSLADGSYTLTIRGDLVHGPGGDLDGDGDGMAGGDHLTAFHRLFGDTDGDADVDVADLDTLFTTFGRSAGDPGFLWYLDHDGDSDVDYDDWLAFRQRFVPPTT